MGRLLLAFCGVSVLALAASAAQAQDQSAPPKAKTADVEEVVVTGTFIRSESFQPSSPVDVLTHEDFEQKAPTSMATYFADLPYNVNSVVTPTGRGAESTAGGGTVNLRNLGSGATLVLFNSHRQTKLPRTANVVDVNSLVPQIAVGNVEILRDGASALYGSDAVGGVVNILTRKNFNGLELQAQDSIVTFSGVGERRFGVLGGGEFGGVHAMAAFEYNDRDQAFPEDLAGTDGTFNLSSPWNPARYTVPSRDAAGALRTTTTTILDQGCGVTIQTLFFRAGQPNVPADACYYDFWPDNSQISEEKRYQAYGELKYDFTEHLRLTGSVAYSDAHLWASQSTTSSITVFPSIIIPGYNPGVAQADRDRLAAGLPIAYQARNASGQLLYAVPSAPGSAIPLRNTAGQVVLTATPTVAASGLPFYEDLTFSGRIFGSQGGLPSNNTTPAGAVARARPAEDKNAVLNLSGGLDGDFGKTWTWSLWGTYSKIEEGNNGQRNNVLIPQLRAALQGFGGPNCNSLTPGQLPGAGNCYYFNPFNNSIYATAGTALANRKDVIDWLMPSVWDQYSTSALVYDAILTGDLFDLPAGALSVAAGAQYRKETWAVDFDSQKNIGAIETGVVSNDVKTDQSAKAVFAELAAPIFSGPYGKLNLNAAVRYEATEGSNTTDPKVGAIWTAPGGRAQLRASWGTSFLAPTLFQRFTSTSNLAVINDTGPGIRGPVATGRVTALSTGNPNLEPQTATSFSIGGMIEPIRNLKVDVTYWHYQFDKLIAAENVQALVTANDPAKVIRDAQNNVIIVKPSQVNLASVETSGFDFQADYSYDFDRYGLLKVGAVVTYVPQYDVQATPTSPVIQAAGGRNTAVTGANTSSQWIGNVRFTWRLGPQTASMLIKYTDGVTNDATVISPGQLKQPSDFDLSSLTTVDLSYSYDFEDLLGVKHVQATVGVFNVLETLAERPTAGFPWTGDPRGRVAFVRLAAKFQ